MNETSDIELVSMACGGDDRAWQCLFDRHYLTVYKLAYRWCGAREDAEDIAQEVFVKLVRKLQTFHRRSSFRTWLYRITVNTARDFGRKRIVRETRERPLDPGQRLHNPAGTPRDLLAATRLRAAVDLLPLKQKEAVTLVLGEGLSHREAAGILGCMEATVSWRIFQAHKKLKKSLGYET